MFSNNSEKEDKSLKSLQISVNHFGEFLAVQEDSVHKTIRQYALFRRVSVCFVSLLDYMNARSNMPKEYLERPMEEIVDYFIKNGCLPKDEKENLLKVAEIYSAIRWPEVGVALRVDMIMKEMSQIYDFFKRVMPTASAFTSEKSMSGLIFEK